MRAFRGPVLLGGLLLVGFFAYRLLVPGLPVSRPVTVRGDAQARPLSSAVASFRPDQIVSVLPRDAIPAIDAPELVTAGQTSLRGADLVIGVEIAGEARAYPVKVLSAHEIVNDEVRGHPFAVTW